MFRINVRNIRIMSRMLVVLFLFASTGCSATIAKARLGAMSADRYFQDALQVELAKAIESGNEEKMKMLISEGANVNAVGKDQIRPLFWALAKNKPESFEFLLKNGADPNFYMKDLDDHPHQLNPSLMEFLSEAKANDYLELALQYGGDPDFLVESYYPSGKLSSSGTIIFSAIMKNRFENVRILAQAGANLNYRDFSGNTPCLAAAAINNYDMVFFFLEQGADPTIENNFGSDLVARITMFGSRGMEPGNSQYSWYLKVLKELESRGLLYNKSLNADASDAGAG